MMSQKKHSDTYHRYKKITTGFVSILVICLSIFISSCNRSRDDIDKMEIYTGAQLKANVLLCKSDQVASAGFWPESGDKARMGGYVDRQSKVTTWRITFKENHAEVVRFTGVSQTIEEPEIYSIETTTSGGILLTYQKLTLGASSQVITIDPANSSFVYSTQHVNPLWNRANIFYGSCKPYL